MSPLVATLVTLCFCAYMLRREQRLNPDASSALWLPVMWTFFIASKFPGQWLALLGLPVGILGPTSEGTPIDAVFFLVLTLCGMRVLSRRGFHLGDFVRDNRCITVFLVYCLLAVFWSDMPFVSLKRWIKILGHPVMALIVLTDPDPIQAVRVFLKKAAILLLPLSMLFIKYYPALGRSFDQWTGAPFNQGVGNGKNGLGAICLIFGLFLFWDLLMAWKVPNRKVRRNQLIGSVGFLLLALWLLHLAQSATSLACLVLGMAAILALGTRFVNPRYIGPTVMAVLLVAAIGEAFGLREAVIHMLGRRTDLTDRTQLWAAVLSMPFNPIFGTGFETFWSGERAAILAAKGFPFIQAHNGYIETYLNLGLIGLCILVVWIFVSFRKIRIDLIKNFDLGRFELAFLFAIVAYNYTEAAYKALHPIWTMFFLVSIRCDSFRWRALSRTEPSDQVGTVIEVEAIPAGAAHATDQWGRAIT